MEALLTGQNVMRLARVLGLCLAIPFHEVAHALASERLGDTTARAAGRITLNPLKHIDLLGLLSMLVMGVGWAKPVPVNARYYQNRKKGMALTALAGPAANLLLAVAAMLLAKCLWYGMLLARGPVFDAAGVPLWQQMEAVAYNVPVIGQWWPLGLVLLLGVLYGFAVVNVSLVLFNLLPISPLDGSRVLGVVLPDKLYFGIMRYERYIMLGLLAVMVVPQVFGVSPLGWLLTPVAHTVLGGLDMATGFVDAAFGLFVR